MKNTWNNLHHFQNIWNGNSQKNQQQQRLTAADKSWADILFSLLGFNTDPCIL
jgi:hypothetical protein